LRRSAAATLRIRATRAILCGLRESVVQWPGVLGSPNEWFNPAEFLAPPNASGFLRGVTHRKAADSDLGLFAAQEYGDSRDALGSLADCRGDHQQVDYIAADSVWSEAAVVVGS